MHTKDYLPESPSKGLPSMRTSKAHLRKPFPKLVSLLKSRTAQNGTANTAAVGDTPKIVVPRAASLDGLPFELKLVILRELSDLQSLRNLIDASASYREVASHSLLFKVFVKDVHPELLFELSLIKTTLENNRDLSTSVSDIREYVQGHRASPKLPSIYEQLAPDLALKILSIQVAVHHATKQFCQPMLSHNPLTGEAVTNKIPLSHNEIRRIHRAFYHFELFCIVFKKLELHRNDPLISQTEQMAFDARGRCLLFLSLFEAFKMEELAIVRDFIMRCYHDMLLESELHLRQYSTARIPRAPWLNWRKETNYVISSKQMRLLPH